MEKNAPFMIKEEPQPEREDPLALRLVSILDLYIDARLRSDELMSIQCLARIVNLLKEAKPQEITKVVQRLARFQC